MPQTVFRDEPVHDLDPREQAQDVVPTVLVLILLCGRLGCAADCMLDSNQMSKMTDRVWQTMPERDYATHFAVFI